MSNEIEYIYGPICINNIRIYMKYMHVCIIPTSNYMDYRLFFWSLYICLAKNSISKFNYQDLCKLKSIYMNKYVCITNITHQDNGFSDLYGI